MFAAKNAALIAHQVDESGVGVLVVAPVGRIPTMVVRIPARVHDQAYHPFVWLVLTIAHVSKEQIYQRFLTDLRTLSGLNPSEFWVVPVLLPQTRLTAGCLQ